MISRAGFPNMYKSDYLEILWLLKREDVSDKRMFRALKLLESRRLPDSTWKSERTVSKLVIPFGAARYANAFITERAKKILE